MGPQGGMLVINWMMTGIVIDDGTEPEVKSVWFRGARVELL